MNTPQYQISTSKLEEAIVHFVVIEEFDMVADLCELLLECESTYSKNSEVHSSLAIMPDLHFEGNLPIKLESSKPATEKTMKIESSVAKQASSGDI